jgi:hypothetical protein
MVLLAVRWPFTTERIARSVAGSTGSRVVIRNSEVFFFPSPGLLARDVELRRGAENAQPIARARRLRFIGSWSALLTFQHRLKRLEAEGLVVMLPKRVPGRDPSAPARPQKATVSLLIADGSIVEAAPDLRFQFERLRLRNFGPGETFTFDTVVQNPNPRGRITATGSVGPWNVSDRGASRVSASYELAGADLGQYSWTAGILTSRGTVKGMLSRLQVNGAADVTNFEINRNGHRVPLRVEYAAFVNGHNGDTTIESANAQFLQTHLNARGAISGSAGMHGKTVALDFVSREAQIQDLLVLATRAQRPALNGPMTLSAHVVLPPRPGRFLEKVLLKGAFRIDPARFNTPSMQHRVNELSIRAQRDDDDPARVLPALSGTVELRQGVANLSEVRFTVPGAVTRGGGTYNVITKAVDLDGTVAMEATLSEATGGWKSLFVKPFNWLFRNRREQAGAELPVRITGRYPNPTFKIVLFGKKRRR